MRKLLMSIGLMVCSLATAFAQENKSLADAGVTMCEYPSVGGGMSKWITSSRGFSVAAELRASVKGTGNERRCFTSWMHIRRQGVKTHTITLAQREDNPDDEWNQENSFEINALSKDGKMLLASKWRLKEIGM